MFGEPLVDNGKPFSECISINPKKTEKKDWTSELEVSFIPMTSVGEHGEITTSETRIYYKVKSGFTYFSENDVLFAKITPCMENGKSAIAKDLKNFIGFGSTEFHVLRPIKNISNPYWIYYLTSFKEFRNFAEKKMTGSAGQKRVPVSAFNQILVNLPTMDLQNKFAAFVQQIDKSKFVLQQQLQFIKKYVIMTSWRKIYFYTTAATWKFQILKYQTVCLLFFSFMITKFLCL